MENVDSFKFDDVFGPDVSEFWCNFLILFTEQGDSKESVRATMKRLAEDDQSLDVDAEVLRLEAPIKLKISMIGPLASDVNAGTAIEQHHTNVAFGEKFGPIIKTKLGKKSLLKAMTALNLCLTDAQSAKTAQELRTLVTDHAQPIFAGSEVPADPTETLDDVTNKLRGLNKK